MSTCRQVAGSRRLVKTKWRAQKRTALLSLTVCPPRILLGLILRVSDNAQHHGVVHPAPHVENMFAGDAGVVAVTGLHVLLAPFVAPPVQLRVEGVLPASIGQPDVAAGLARPLGRRPGRLQAPGGCRPGSLQAAGCSTAIPRGSMMASFTPHQPSKARLRSMHAAALDPACMFDSPHASLFQWFLARKCCLLHPLGSHTKQPGLLGGRGASPGSDLGPPSSPTGAISAEPRSDSSSHATASGISGATGAILRRRSPVSNRSSPSAASAGVRTSRPRAASWAYAPVLGPRRASPGSVPMYGTLRALVRAAPRRAPHATRNGGAMMPQVRRCQVG